MCTLVVTAVPHTTLRYLMTAEHASLPTTHDTVLSTLLVGTVTLISELPRPDFHQPYSAKSNSSSPTARLFDLSIMVFYSRLSCSAALMR